jgi:Type II secretion system (T2SS), protein M subtype b
LTRWQLERALRSPRWAWGALCFAIVIAVAIAWLAGHASGWVFRSDTSLSSPTADDDRLMGVAGTSAGAPGMDFAAALPREANAAAMLAEIDRATLAAGVSLLSTSVAVRAPGPDSLGRLDVTAHLRGPYPKVKQVLKEVLQRFPNTTLSSLRASPAAMTMAGAPNPATGSALLVEVTAVFGWWTAAPPQAGSMSAALSTGSASGPSR